MRHELVATATFGLESVVAEELSALGLKELRVEDRRVRFACEPLDVARCNLWLRAADRVFLRLASFAAADFDGLYDGVREIVWRDLLPHGAAVRVAARSTKSRLSAVPAIQSVAKKAVVDALAGGRTVGMGGIAGHGTRGGTRGGSRGGRGANAGRGPRIEESGPELTVSVEVKDDRVEVLLDTSGEGLHKRGWRIAAGDAPLRENLAAGLVLLSKWTPARPFADPLCGSGTIAIEAALYARNIAPGANRAFAGEALPILPAELWRRAREEEQDERRLAARRDMRLEIQASDRDPAVVELARANAKTAGVLDAIRFQRRALEAFEPAGDHGCVVTNPPYGERLGSEREVERLYRAMGRLYRRLPTWSWFVLTAHPGFTRLFGARESRNRKLYNGNLRCWLHQYFGPLPTSVSPRPSDIRV